MAGRNADRLPLFTLPALLRAVIPSDRTLWPDTQPIAPSPMQRLRHVSAAEGSLPKHSRAVGCDCYLLLPLLEEQRVQQELQAEGELREEEASFFFFLFVAPLQPDESFWLCAH